jgi:hypothetical protein
MSTLARGSCWLLAGALAACAPQPSAPPLSSLPVPTGSAAPEQEFAGWYMEHGQAATFLACGAQAAWPVASSRQLSQRARAFGLAPDLPVYVRVRGSRKEGRLVVTTVSQFGSPTPIRDCPMTGVVLPSE